MIRLLFIIMSAFCFFHPAQSSYRPSSFIYNPKTHSLWEVVYSFVDLPYASEGVKEEFQRNTYLALREVPYSEQEELIRLVSSLINPRLEHARYLIQTLAKVPQRERSSLVSLATSMLTPDRSNADYIVNVLAKQTEEQRESFVKMISPLLSDRWGACSPSEYRLDERRLYEYIYSLGYTRDECYRMLMARLDQDGSVVDELLRMPVPEREPFVRLIEESDFRIGRNTFALVSTLRSIDADHRQRLVELLRDPATTLIITDEHRHNVPRLIQAFRGIPFAEWEARARRARAEIDLPADSPNFLDRLVRLLETPLQAPIPPLWGGMEAIAVQGGYAFGVNVHDGDRDSHTAQAYQKLLNTPEQKSLKTADVKASYEDFMRALDALDNADIRRRARITLGLEAHSGGGFGPLNERVTSCGISMDHTELLGRLWYFANTYKDPLARTSEDESRERNNARASLFAALADAIEKDGHLVCNPGKLQRIVTSFLQGRLEGVNVDGSVVQQSLRFAAADSTKDSKTAEEPKLSAADTTDIVRGGWDNYMRVLNREPTLADLDTFKKAFINDNPLINEAAFNATIEAIKDILSPEEEDAQAAE